MIVVSKRGLSRVPSTNLSLVTLSCRLARTGPIVVTADKTCMYSVDADGGLTELRETPYKLEAHLQEIIASHPALLAGNQMNAEAPRRFLLATAEAGIAINDSEADHFSLDLLFLDQDAILTLVEVKRSSDTRIRREVVGQLLEYAANVSAFWTAAKVRAYYEKQSEGSTLGFEAELLHTLGLEEGAYEEYWQSLQANLNQQKMRLVLVADKVPVETLRIIEYLNRQMTSTDVFAIAVTQFSGLATSTLTTRVLNPSVSDTSRKTASAARGPQWTRERFYDAMSANEPSAAVEVIRQIENWAIAEPQINLAFGSGAQHGSIQVEYHSKPGQPYRAGSDAVALTLWTSAEIEIDFQFLAAIEPFREESKRFELLERLNSIGCDISPKKVSKRPNISWSVLADPTRMEEFLKIQAWVLSVILQAAPAE